MTGGAVARTPVDGTAARGGAEVLPIDADAAFYTIGQVAGLLGSTPAALRRIEREALVRPRRSEGGQRRYSRNDLLRLREVLALADEGLTAAGVRRVLELQDRVLLLEREVAALRGRPA